MSLVIDLLSICSVLGIWPRFIEPRLLKTTKKTWDLPPTYSSLDGLKIVHLSDLHFSKKISSRFLKKIAYQVSSLKPDLIVFTGDFLCYSQLEDESRLLAFLNQFQAPLGCFCTLGNHDYASYASRSLEGVYDLLPPPQPLKSVVTTLKKLMKKMGTSSSQTTERVRSVPIHPELAALLSKTPFKLLENEEITLPIGLSIAGLGDYALGRCLPEKTFLKAHPSPGIILSHNPDTLALLRPIAGHRLILSGHTHGEQIHLPWPPPARRLSKKLTFLDNPSYTRGWYDLGDKQLYVNRGLGGHKPFRLCSPPEICLIKIAAKKSV